MSKALRSNILGVLVVLTFITLVSQTNCLYLFLSLVEKIGYISLLINRRVESGVWYIIRKSGGGGGGGALRVARAAHGETIINCSDYCGIWL